MDRLAGERSHAIEAVRMGMIFAHDAKQYGRWRRAVDRKAPPSRQLDDAGLEAAVRRVATLFPENVVYGEGVV